MTKARFAERIGRNRVNIYGLLRSPDCSTAVLRKVCTALDYDFFQLLSKDTRTKGRGQLVAAPAAPGVPGGRAPMRIVIEVDPADEQAQMHAGRLAAELLRASKD